MSTASRVVPATSLTMARGSLISALISDDLPTLGRPTMASRVGRAGRTSGSSCSTASPQSATMASRKSSRPRRCAAETGKTPAKPSRGNSPSRLACLSPSTLFAATKTGRLALAQKPRDDLVERREAFPRIDDEDDLASRRPGRVRLHARWRRRSLRGRPRRCRRCRSA